MGIGITFPDDNEQVVLYGVDEFGQLFDNENRNYDRISKLIIKASYNALFLYGMAKGIFSPIEIREHVMKHGFAMSAGDVEPSPFEEKVISLMQSEETQGALRMFVDASTLSLMQATASGVVIAAEDPEGYDIAPIITPLFA